jgi:multidrug efflux pump subunit AcrB
MLTVLAVFLPALFLVGVPRQLFVPLALAVALAMAASYVLSSTLVPVLAAWFVRGHPMGATRIAVLTPEEARAAERQPFARFLALLAACIERRSSWWGLRGLRRRAACCCRGSAWSSSGDRRSAQMRIRAAPARASNAPSRSLKGAR